MTLLSCIIAYLLGSIPNGLILCRAIWRIDIREYGSRNIGATNVYRTLGKGPGALVFLLDFLKGFLGVIAMLMPALTGIVFLIWLGIVFVTRYVSLGSIVGAALVPVLALFFSYPMEYTLFGVFAAVLVIVRHHANITRLMNGTESKIKAGKR